MWIRTILTNWTAGGKMQGSNELSLYYSARLAWMWGDRELANSIISDANSDLIRVLKAWIKLTNGDIDEAIHIFTSVMANRVHSFDVFLIYGLSLARAAKHETSECVQLIARILGKYDFPELIIIDNRKSKKYMRHSQKGI
jgi:hypothetical protein